MAKQEFYQPKRRRDNDQGGVYDDAPFSTPPGGQLPNSNGAAASQGAQNTLDNIDDVLRDNEENPGFFNPRGDEAKGDSAAESPEDLATAEKNPAPASTSEPSDKIGKGFSPAPTAGALAGLKQFFWSSRRRRISTLGGGVTGGAIGLVIAFAGFASGPLQLVHLSQILSKNFSHSERTTRLRSNRLFRAARNNDLSETRVSRLGSKVFSDTISQLKDIGIEFQRNSFTGKPISATIDTNKLADKYPELKGMSTAEVQGFLSEHFDLDAHLFTRIGGSSVFTVDTSEFSFGATRALANNALSHLDDGSIVTAIKARIMAKFFDIPSLFHPFRRLTADQENKLTLESARRAAEEERAKTVQPELNTEELAAESNLKDRVKGLQGKISNALLITAAMCTARAIANDIPKVNYAAIAAPAAVDAVDKIAVGAQVQSGQDMSNTQAAQVAESFVDSNGKTIWGGKALQATEGVDNRNGADLSPDYAQAFSNDTTSAHILSVIGGGIAGTAACSPIGQVTQFALALGAIVGGFFTADASWGAYAAAKGAETAATAGAVYMIEHEAVNLLKSNAIVPSILSGPMGGNLLAYGAREAAGIEARASGGIALAGSQTSVTDLQDQQQEQKDFESKTYFARVFDVHDYRSLVSHLIDSTNPGIGQNVSNIGSALLNFNKLLGSVFSAFTAPVHAASPPYNWGFPQYGIPDSIVNNPAYDDPYANADTTAEILDSCSSNGTNDSSCSYIQKAQACFGVNISKDSGVWDAVTQKDVIPTDQSYLDGSCDSTSDPNWQRMMLFIFDTRTMDAIACYQGGSESAQACSDVGYGSTGASAPAPSSWCGGTGGYGALVGPGASFAGVDQGIDFIPSGSSGFDICAPASGTITLADQTGHHFDRTSGQAEIIEQLDQAPNAPSSSKYIYYAEIIQINSAIHVGTHVSKGTIIGHNDQSPGIEVGWALNATQGFMCSIGYPTPCGTSFNDWVKAGGGP